MKVRSLVAWGLFVVLFLMAFAASATSVFAETASPVTVPCIHSTSWSIRWTDWW
jgi:hypothetical protein